MCSAELNSFWASALLPAARSGQGARTMVYLLSASSISPDLKSSLPASRRLSACRQRSSNVMSARAISCIAAAGVARHARLSGPHSSVGLCTLCLSGCLSV
jgi:hypothetical protein